MLTAAGPYAELIDYGQSRRGRAEIMNVSVRAASLTPTPRRTARRSVVTARRQRRCRPARDLALDIAKARRGRAASVFILETNSRSTSSSRWRSPVGNDRAKEPLAFADVADNPGGGGRGNTTGLLRALHEAGASGVLLGVFHDPALAAEAQELWRRRALPARFNRAGADGFSEPFAVPADVAPLFGGRCRGRRGIFAGYGG